MRSEHSALFDPVLVESCDMRSDFSARLDKGGGLSFDNRVVAFQRKVKISSRIQLADFSDNEPVCRRRKQQRNFARFLVDDATHRLRKNVVSDKNRYLVSPLDMSRSLSAANRRFVDDIVMDKTRQMKQFDSCTGVRHPRRIGNILSRSRNQGKNRRADLLSLASNQFRHSFRHASRRKTGNFGDDFVGTVQIVLNLTANRCQDGLKRRMICGIHAHD